jgi:hypothetical protein
MTGKFKVNRMFLSGRGKKIYEQGNIISADQVENFVDLVANNSLIPCDENGEDLKSNDDTSSNDASSNEADSKKDDTSKVENPIYSFVNAKNVKIDVYEISDATVTSMRAELVSRGVLFDPMADKKELFELISK